MHAEHALYAVVLNTGSRAPAAPSPNYDRVMVDRSSCIPTAIPEVDDFIGGILPGELVVLGGHDLRAPRGLAAHIAAAIALRHHVLVYGFSGLNIDAAFDRRVPARRHRSGISCVSYREMVFTDWSARTHRHKEEYPGLALVLVDDDRGLTFTAGKRRRNHQEIGGAVKLFARREHLPVVVVSRCPAPPALIPGPPVPADFESGVAEHADVLAVVTAPQPDSPDRGTVAMLDKRVNAGRFLSVPWIDSFSLNYAPGTVQGMVARTGPDGAV